MDEPILGVIITGIDGKENKYIVLNKFTVGSQDYIALKPYESNENLVELFRYTTDGDNNSKISNIETDEELYEAKNVFEQIYVAAFESEANKAQPAVLSMEKPDSAVISVPDNNGINHDCEIIQTFAFNSKNIIALMPLETNGYGTMNIQLYEYHISSQDNGFDSIQLYEIPELDYEHVRAYFMDNLMNDDNSYDG